jgi:hypothetical protein
MRNFAISVRSRSVCGHSKGRPYESCAVASRSRGDETAASSFALSGWF